MIELQAAIVNLFSSTSGSPAVHNSFYTAIGGRLYFKVAPQDTSYPYSTFHIGPEVYDYMFKENFDNVIVQFNIYSTQKSSVEVGNATRYLKSLFDWCKLVVSDFTFLKMERIYSTIDWFQEEDYWQSVVQYRILLES